MNALAACAHVLARLGQHERAVRALGANWAQATKLGHLIEPEGDELEELWLQQTGVGVIRDSMSAQQWDALIEAGRQVSIEDAFADALAPVTAQHDQNAGQ